MSETVPENVKKCLAILNSAKNDTEKFAALFMVTKLVKGKDCNSYCKKLLFESIGVAFLKRLLLSPDVPAGCPPQVYKSVAMSVLSAFCREPEIATHPQILSNISIFLDIVQQADADDYEDDLIVINETYQCLLCIAAHESGQNALLDIGAVSKMSQIYSQLSFQTDEALNILVILVGRFGSAAWSGDYGSFNALMNVLSLDFETDHSDRKFKLCPIMHALLYNCPNDLIDHVSDESWPVSILKGVTDILTSKIGKVQRDPALILVSQIITVLGVEWTLLDEEKPKQFFLLLIQLSSIEVRMQLEDRKFDQIMENAALAIACFSILESCAAYIGTDALELEQKEKQQVYTALKGAFAAVVSTLHSISQTKRSLTVPEKLLVYAMVRAFAGWLAQEASTLRSDVYTTLPFILTLANESFYSYRSKTISERVKKEPSASTSNAVDGSVKSVDDDPLGNINLLRFLLPALCHLVVEEKGRQVFLKERQEEILYECLTFYWSIVNYKKPPIPRSERKKLLLGNQEPPKLSQKALNDIDDARTAMISICNIFMNITVLESKLVEESTSFNSLAKFIFNNLPELKNVSENLVLHGNMAVLGLLLLKHQSKRVKKDDFTICRYIQSTIRFLWDAYCVEESNDSSTLVVSMAYKKYWMEIMELWFLGMQTLSSILPIVPWISEFAIESGWIQGIMEMLKQVKVGSLPANTKCAYEDFLCHIIDANKDVKKVLKEHNALSICRNHRFMEVGKRLFGD